MKLRLHSMGNLTRPTEDELDELRRSENENRAPPVESALPNSFDSRTRGCTGRLRNQGRCGGCWAFGAAETFTENYCHSEKYIVEMSDQDLISCDRTSFGCRGGGLTQTWRWIQSRGITTES